MFNSFKLVMLVFFSILFGKVYSQSCGTVVPPEYFDVKKTAAVQGLVHESAELKGNPNVNISLSVYYHENAQINTVFNGAMAELNAAFEPIGISFTICNEDTFEGGIAGIVYNNDDVAPIIKKYNEVNTINVYVARTVYKDGELVGGFATLPPLTGRTDEFIFISGQLYENSSDLAKTMIHEMGHFFGLLHTHEDNDGENEELVDGSNCDTHGDLVCDTEASPNLKNIVTGDCEIFEVISRDSNGDHYTPSVTNHMAYSPQECRCRFTPGQYERMLQFYWSSRTHLR